MRKGKRDKNWIRDIKSEWERDKKLNDKETNILNKRERDGLNDRQTWTEWVRQTKWERETDELNERQRDIDAHLHICKESILNDEVSNKLDLLKFK